MNKYLFFLLTITILSASCIGNDFVDDMVDPVLRITNPIDSIAVDSSYQFEFMYLNNVGKEVSVEALWSSSNEDVIAIDANGLATALNGGSSEITLEYEDGAFMLMDTRSIGVGERTVITETSKFGTIEPSSFYVLEGSFTLEQEGSDLVLAFAEDYEASTALPGLYVYLTNNPNTTSGALEIGAVEVFKGEHTYTIENTDINEYGYVLYFCKPFNVKVGDGEIEG